MKLYIAYTWNLFSLPLLPQNLAKRSTMMHLLPPSLILLLVPNCIHARRGALVRDGMSSKQAYDNPLLGKPGDITIDPDVVAITTRCSKWSLDPIDCDTISSGTTANTSSSNKSEEENNIVKEIVSKEMSSLPLHITFRSKILGGGKRPNWMRATATLGDPSILKSKATPLRAVWTCSNADADSSMTYEEMKNGRVARKEIGSNVLEDSYEDCLKRLYGKYVELEVLLPRTKRMMTALNRISSTTSSGNNGGPQSVVYRVPIQGGHVNPFGMVSKSRATVTLYPKGRTLSASNASGPGAVNVPKDVAIPFGLSNVHVPL